MSATPNDVQTDLAAAQDQQRTAQGALQDTISNFNPPQNAAPASFDQPAPQDHFNDIVGLSPLLMALGAIGGKFGRAHGIAMLQSTNAMMSGIVKGSAEQYADARQQYETKYEQWKDQNRTWNDTYKAYMQAYKGRVDAQQRAVQGANAAVGIAQKNASISEKQVDQKAKLDEQIRLNDAKIRRLDSQNVTDDIKAKSSASKAETAEKEAALKVEQVRTQAKTADANTLTATSRSLKSEADAILKQYPASAGKRPPEVDAKLKGIRDSMDVVNEKLEEHTQQDYNQNKSAYDEARAAIKAGADPTRVKARLAEQGLSPDAL
jgi:hypothetical protein